MHIGYVALSGLRLADADLLRLGLSFPAVGRRAKEIEALPSLGLLTLAGMAPEPFTAEYVEARDLAGIPDRFDAVALSTLTATAKEAYALADGLRARGTPVVLGGLHATLAPQKAMPHVDALVIGEGEPVWLDVLDDLAHGRLKPLYDARERGPFDLALSPMPRFDLLEPDRYPRLTVQTQRGCPWSCDFCAASMRLSPSFRVKPVDRVIAEVRRVKALFGRPALEFADDNTFASKRHGKLLMRALAPEGMRWFTETDISVADDPDLLKAMRDAGCQSVLIGLESPRADPLEGVETRANWKARRADGYLRAIETIQRHGIGVNGCFVVGLDGDGPEVFDAIIDFAGRSGLFDVQVTLLTPFPGTPLWDRLSAEGRLLSSEATERCTLFDINFVPERMEVETLRAGFRDLISRLYAPPFVAQRVRRFRQQRKEGPL